jgi:glycosyltransferase involved in cell wall biosynthesis
MTATRLEIRHPASTPAAPAPRARRVLQVLSSLERGGIDLWLMQLLRRIDRDRWRMDFLILSDREGALEREAESLGSHIVRSPQHRNPWRLRRDFGGALRRFGPYDVVHGHMHHLNGLVLRLASWHGVPVRIAHSHSDTRAVEAAASWRRRLYLNSMKRWICRYSSHRIAVSDNAAKDLFGPDWQTDLGCEIIPCGIDIAAFKGGDALRARTREALGLREDAFVIGHVGRFKSSKNHRFLLDVAAAVFAREPRASLVLVGDGELMPEIEARARELGIADRVAFVGARADVPALMRAMDVFVFPSQYEGLGLVLLEAQASGLPCVLAEGLPREVDIVAELIYRLPLTAPAATWASVILRVAIAARPSHVEAWRALNDSQFTIERSIERVVGVYERGLEARRG